MLSRCLVAVLVSAMPLAAQSTIVVRDAGPGAPGMILQSALAAPHVLIGPTDEVASLPRDSVFGRTVLVIAPRTTVASTVRGDVIVIGGDLFLHPGASIDGRAISIGGAVYNSTLATVGGDRLSFRDVTFVVTPTPDGFSLSHRLLATDPPPAVLTLPLVYGLRVPTYTRVDGLVVPVGPRITLARGAVRIDPLVSYRSDLGEIDPSIEARADLSPLLYVDAIAARGTFTNDRWIRSDLINAVTTLFAGADTRNYFRTERFEARIHRGWTPGELDLGLSIGGRTERAWSVAAGGPWSAFGRRDPREGMLRPNPPVAPGRLSSGLVGARGGWSVQQVSIGLGAESEVAWSAPGGGRFTQTTIDLRVDFPTFSDQTFALESHAVVTAGDSVPPQRYAYLGGSATLPTLRLLEMGGGHLLFVESRYNVPFERLRVPFVGAPVLTLRHMIGAAGVGKVPELEQNLGVRLQVSILRADFTVNPANGDREFAAGLSVR